MEKLFIAHELGLSKEKHNSKTVLVLQSATVCKSQNTVRKIKGVKWKQDQIKGAIAHWPPSPCHYQFVNF